MRRVAHPPHGASATGRLPAATPFKAVVNSIGGCEPDLVGRVLADSNPPVRTSEAPCVARGKLDLLGVALGSATRPTVSPTAGAYAERRWQKRVDCEVARLSAAKGPGTRAGGKRAVPPGDRFPAALRPVVVGSATERFGSYLWKWKRCHFFAAILAAVCRPARVLLFSFVTASDAKRQSSPSIPTERRCRVLGSVSGRTRVPSAYRVALQDWLQRAAEHPHESLRDALR